MKRIMCYSIILIFAGVSTAIESESTALRSTGHASNSGMPIDRHREAHDPEMLTTVSAREIALCVYRRIKDQNANPVPQSAINPNIKNRICHHIGRSSYFHLLLNTKPIYMHSLHETLKNSNPDILLSLYEPSPNHAPGQTLVYTNPTNLIRVRLISNTEDLGIYEEYAFRFLTSVSTVDEDEEAQPLVSSYFISEEYNVSDTPDFSYIAGRFIFEEDESEDESDEITDKTLFALAEEPATTVLTRGFEVEIEYLRRREAINEPGDKDEDQMCRLNLNQRLRVCSQVLGSSHLAREIQFVPDKKYVDESDCFEKEIFFEDERIRFQAGGRIFTEWMIRCRPVEYYADYQYEYFLSRVYDSHSEVFAYRRGPNSKVVLENLFDDVRFINY